MTTTTTQADKRQADLRQPAANCASVQRCPTVQGPDLGTAAHSLGALQRLANQSPQARKTAQLRALADRHAEQGMRAIQRSVNGLPENLRSGVESLSGYAMGDVKVFYNSSKPAQLRAHAFAQGTHIHLAAGQERHLPHEAWHVVQQKQGRVKPTAQLRGMVNVNDDAGLEAEADVMGAKAMQLHGYGRGAPAPVFHGAGGGAVGTQFTVQCRFTQADKEFSFLSNHDLNGNPYLASEAGGATENWQLNAVQSNVAMTQVDDMYTTVTDENRHLVYHNLSMGREQRVSVDGQKAVLNPVKSYIFGPDTVSDVAVFNVGRDGDGPEVAEKAKFYRDYLNVLEGIKEKYLEGIKEKYVGDGNRAAALAAASAALAATKSAMRPLILAEDYRTRGAITLFNVAWGKVQLRFQNLASLPLPSVSADESNAETTKRSSRSRQIPPSARKEAITELTNAIRGATTELPWAGLHGKETFRNTMKATNGEQWDESRRSINRRSVSPSKMDTGGAWTTAAEEGNGRKKLKK